MTHRRPNILIFMTDQQQGATVLHGHPCLTPNAQRLARQGVTFERAYCPTAHCCPSRATFQTGLYPSRHGVWNNVTTPSAIHRDLKPSVQTFGPELAAAGYRLAFSGKWHVTAESGPADHGWHECLVRNGPMASSQSSPADIMNDKRALADHKPRQRGQVLREGWRPVNLYGTQDDATPRPDEDEPDRAVIDAALSALPQLSHGDEPWCLYVGPHNPHDPFTAPRHFVDQYNAQDIHLPRSFSDTLKDKPGIYRRLRGQLWDQLSESEVREAIAHYWAKCTMADAWLGELLDALDASGQADDTLVLMLSDHGDYAGAHGLFLKGVAAFDQAYHIPCIARWPNGIASPGRSDHHFVSLADFAPTLLDLAGVSYDADRFTGQSLLPLLSDTAPVDRRGYRHTQFNAVELYYTQRSVADERFKYVYNGFDVDELYDLQHDPDELNNLADDPAYDDQKKRLCVEMWRFAAEQDDQQIFNDYGTVALAPYGPATTWP